MNESTRDDVRPVEEVYTTHTGAGGGPIKYHHQHPAERLLSAHPWRRKCIFRSSLSIQLVPRHPIAAVCSLLVSRLRGAGGVGEVFGNGTLL